MRYAIVLVLLSLPAAAAPKQKLQLEWTELGAAIEGKEIKLVLPKGVEVKGTAAAVEPDALLMRVTGTSDSKTVRKGEARIPRSSIHVIRIERYSKIWRAILTPAIPLGLVLAMVAAVSPINPTPAPEVVVRVGAVAVFGSLIPAYYLGNRLDRRESVEIRIRGN